MTFDIFLLLPLTLNFQYWFSFKIGEVPNESFSPIVQAELAEGAILQTFLGPSLEPVFRCVFNAIMGKPYAYDIYWLIDNQSIIVNKRIPNSNINETLLRPKDWINDYKLNMMVSQKVLIFNPI